MIYNKQIYTNTRIDRKRALILILYFKCIFEEYKIVNRFLRIENNIIQIMKLDKLLSYHL